MSKRTAEDKAFFVVSILLGSWVTVIIFGFLVYLGQQLLWQLRRSDCGLYTVSQQKSGDIPLRCVTDDKSKEQI